MKMKAGLVVFALQVSIMCLCLLGVRTGEDSSYSRRRAGGQTVVRGTFDVGVYAQGAASRELLAREAESLRQLSTVLSEILLELNRNAITARLLPTSFKVRLIESGLRKHSKEVEVFNTLSKQQQHNFVVNVLVQNKLAMQAYEENLDIIKRLNEFNVDPDAVLLHAKQLSS